MKIPDIDSDRVLLNIASGKGPSNRPTRHPCRSVPVPLSPRLLEALREYWRKYRPADFLFPGKTADKPYAQTSIQKAIKASARRAGISKRVHPHVLRLGTDYSDWHLKTPVESAKESTRVHGVVRVVPNLYGGPCLPG